MKHKNIPKSLIEALQEKEIAKVYKSADSYKVSLFNEKYNYEDGMSLIDSNLKTEVGLEERKQLRELMAGELELMAGELELMAINHILKNARLYKKSMLGRSFPPLEIECPLEAESLYIKNIKEVLDATFNMECVGLYIYSEDLSPKAYMRSVINQVLEYKTYFVLSAIKIKPEKG